mmetsp:Transcript_16499/g.15823  ORF Transcript_16499/g.15823 Transcript_16499/m.15823 type:complete len:255 (+) Transcript_16499:125-889(+)
MIRKNQSNHIDKVPDYRKNVNIYDNDDDNEVDLSSSDSRSTDSHKCNGNTGDRCNDVSISSSKRIFVADEISKVERVVFPLEGVKFLSLNNRSHLEGNLNPRKLCIVDSVLRDLELKRLTKVLHETEPTQEEEVTDVITVVVEDAVPLIIYPEKNTVVAKNPFMASIQYECLEHSTDIIYKLIKSVRDSDVNQQDTAPDEYVQSELNPLKNLEIAQAQRLEELTLWRLQLMGKISEYNKIQSIHDRVDANAILN